MGDVTYGPGEAEARAALLVCGFPNSTTRSIALSNLILAARAEGATAERARLAGLASEEDRGMVDALDSICRSGRVTHLEWLEAYTTLLARLAAARGEDAPPSDAQSARQPGDPCDCGAMWAERDRLRTALAAAERAGAEAALEWAASNPAGFPVQFRGLPVTWNAADETVAMYQRRGLATLFPEATDA